MMNKIKGILLIIGLLSGGVMAQDSAVGTWEGKLEVAPGNSITVLFEISRQDDGSLKAVLNSPDMGAIKNIAASSVSYQGGQLDIVVDALSGSYSGKPAAGGFTGEWSQPGSTIAMALTPFEAKVLSAEAMAVLMGQWHGKLMGPGITYNMVFHFEEGENGEFLGFVQNADAGPQKQPLADISLDGDKFFFRVPAANAEYTGTLSGQAISGRLKQGPQDFQLDVEKGEYVAEIPVLELSDADFALLAGKWTGDIQTPQATLAMALRFEIDAEGNKVGFIDSITQGVTDLKVTSATLTDGHVEVVLNVPPAKFTGDLDGNTINGTWSQGPGNMPLKLSRE